MSDRITIDAEVETSRILGSNFWGRATVRFDDGKRATVVGSMLGCEPGESVRITGVWTMHPKYGEQFKASVIEPIRASTPNGAIAWLTKRLPRIGVKRAELMIARWGVQGTWDVLEQTPELLAELPGVRDTDIKLIKLAYQKHRDERDRMVALRDLGLTDAQASAAVAAYGDDAAARIRENPFDMIEHVRGIGFKRADGIAKNCGLRHDAPARIEAGIAHMLKEAAAQGHTYVPMGKLRDVTARLLTVGPEKVQAVMWEMRQQRRLVGKPSRAQLRSLQHAERSIAGCVQRLLEGHRKAAA
jgi:exodeoxyribonuclease V alpha subunit